MPDVADECKAAANIAKVVTPKMEAVSPTQKIF